MQGQTEVDWNEYAKCYDSLNGLRSYRNMQARVFKALQWGKGHNVLDAACGTGNFIQQFSHNSDWPLGLHITGIDFSENMLGIAQGKKFNAHVSLLLGDLNRLLKFSDNNFDRVVSVNTLYTLNDPLKVLQEFFRLLKQGGRIVLVTPKKGYENGLILKAHSGDEREDSFWLNVHSSLEREERLLAFAITDQRLRSCMLKLARFNQVIAVKKEFHFFTTDELVALFKKAGFVRIKSQMVYAEQNIMVEASKED